MLQYQQESLLGAMALSKGNHQDAINHIEKSFALAKSAGLNSSDDTFEAGYFNMAQAKKAMRRFTEAISDYQKVLALNSKNESAYIRIAECCFEIDTPVAMEIAINSLNDCTSLFSKNTSAFMNKGIAYLKIGDKSNARLAFQSAKSLGNKDADNFIRDYCS
jgi:tetratricopeptide (TPR) repeat protein